MYAGRKSKFLNEANFTDKETSNQRSYLYSSSY